MLYRPVSVLVIEDDTRDVDWLTTKLYSSSISAPGLVTIPPRYPRTLCDHQRVFSVHAVRAEGGPLCCAADGGARGRARAIAVRDAVGGVEPGHSCGKRPYFQLFPDVCPEPVLVNCSFLR